MTNCIKKWYVVLIKLTLSLKVTLYFNYKFDNSNCGFPNNEQHNKCRISFVYVVAHLHQKFKWSQFHNWHVYNFRTGEGKKFESFIYDFICLEWHAKFKHFGCAPNFQSHWRVIVVFWDNSAFQEYTFGLSRVYYQYSLKICLFSL